MGVFNSAVPFGTVISANLFGVLGGKFYWRSIILALAGFVGLVLVISGIFISLPKKKKQVDTSPRKSSGGLFTNKSLWFLSVIWMFANFQLLSYVTFAPQYYQNIGMSVQKAGLITSLIMLLPIFLSPLAGMLVDKTGWKKSLILFGSIAMGIAFVLISKVLLGVEVWAALLGIGFASIPVVVFSLLPDLIKPHQMGMGLGFITIASNVGIAVGPSAFGVILDKTGGNFNLGFISLGLISLIMILALKGIKEKKIKE